MKIYTKTGDQGETGLFGGGRVAKDEIRIEAYGTVDELNAGLGLARADLATLLAPSQPDGGVRAPNALPPAQASSGAAAPDYAALAELDRLLASLQCELFDVGAELATVDPVAAQLAQVGAAAITALEGAIDRYEATLPPLKQFILPGGSRLAAQLHSSRTVCRRAERRVVSLARSAVISPQIVVYLNRLSDLLFVLARAANQMLGVPDTPWTSTRR